MDLNLVGCVDLIKRHNIKSDYLISENSQNFNKNLNFHEDWLDNAESLCNFEIFKDLEKKFKRREALNTQNIWLG